MKYNKEVNVCIQLNDWFEKNEIKCWLNYGEKKFIVKGLQKKPDMIIYSNKIKQYIVIETKRGDINSRVYDASKIIDYWHNYIKEKTKYFIENEEIKISTFTIATLYSMFGTLFKDDELINSNNDEWNRINKLNGYEPLFEGKNTRPFVRNLWANWRRIRGKNQSGMGIIVSDTLNDKNNIFRIGKPLVFRIQWGSKKNKEQWCVRQELL